MFQIPLNKFEKEKRVIELHLQGKTIREIAKEVHISFRDISKLIKSYDKKIRIQQNKKEENNQSSKIKKPSKSSQAYELFLKGRTPVQVAIDLDLDFQKARKYWTEFLRLKNMKKLYNIYIENEFHLDYLFKIYYFMLRNNISIKDIENVLRSAHNVMNLNNSISKLKLECETWHRVKNNQDNAPLEPLPRLHPYHSKNY
jgi:transposase